MRAFVEDLGLDGFEHIADQGSSIWRAFDITAQPSFIFIDDNGVIVRHIGALERNELIAQLDLMRST